MWALAHPLRFRLFELLVEGPSTASRLARQLGESSGSTRITCAGSLWAGAIVEAPELGTRRERWWQRRERLIQIPTDADLEGRAISARMFGMFFARDEEARHRFITRDIDANLAPGRVCRQLVHRRDAAGGRRARRALLRVAPRHSHAYQLTAGRGQGSDLVQRPALARVRRKSLALSPR